MAEDKKEVKEEKKKQKNYLVLFAIAVLIGAGAYYFFNSRNINSSAPPSQNTEVSGTPQDSNSPSELTAKKWTWVNTQMSDGAEFLPSNEGGFTLTFQPDMRVLATTDCNNGNGSYELGPDNSLTMGPMATTMMFCEGSSETDFYQGLANVGSYKIDGGQLWLMLKLDSGTMIFE